MAENSGEIITKLNTLLQLCNEIWQAVKNVELRVKKVENVVYGVYNRQTDIMEINGAESTWYPPTHDELLENGPFHQ